MFSRQGGQPSITYVSRSNLGIENDLKKAISQKSLIVSLTGPTKSGKTVLCRNVLADKKTIWIEGGQIKSESDFWSRICYGFNYPVEIKKRTSNSASNGGSISIGGEIGVPGNKITGGIGVNRASSLSIDSDKLYRIDALSTAVSHMVENKITLVVDDFHYIPDEVRASCIRSLKGAIFNGLKVVLLSTPHRAFEAIKAEAEVTGRFKHVTVPTWSVEDLSQIAINGFKALNILCPNSIVSRFSDEALGSPLLMQNFCWHLCYDSGFVETTDRQKRIHGDFNLSAIFNEIAEDTGLPIYEKLAKGPQSRADRIARPLSNGGTADIYQAILLAIADTGPKQKITYNEIRASLNKILSDKVPQKLEVSNALIHLSDIDKKENKGDRAIDWDSNNLDLVITDPYFRFYLKWKATSKVGDK